MFNEIIVNIHPFEKRVAILEDGKLVELFVEKKEQQNIVGNIYKGYVKDVLPGMGAAFIDIGVERTAFLHYTDIVTDFLELADSDVEVPNRLHRDSSKIGKYLKAGQEIVVQVQKGPIGKKGARLTQQISLPGKFIVYFPNKNKVAISRKINTGSEKSRIKKIIDSVKHKDVGLIVRTEADGLTREDIEREYNGLHNTWRVIDKQIQHAKPPTCIFDENNLSNTLIRDLFSSKIDRLVVDDKQFRNRLVQSVREFLPDLANRIELYTEDSPIFDAYGIEKEIQSIFTSRVPLPSGGNMVIEQTEALVSVDINTGSFIGRRNYDATVLKTNLEAAHEIARQIRLRDLTGMMVIDFIDMSGEGARRDVLDALRTNMRRDRARNKVYPFTALGLVEITRKRTRPSLLMAYSEHCECCNGTGRVMSRDSMAMRVYRWMSRAEYFVKGQMLRLVVHPNVKQYFDEHPNYLRDIDLKILVEADKHIAPDVFNVFEFDSERDITSRFNV
ncbi:MAG: Rne/Rng family ribonuclease [Candidatus Cloacimonetes bacterium]|nr:Rne/Rng family ribonuclease [Candidatus Cloacimonadota bacterium]